jgi:hypothetical protein
METKKYLKSILRIRNILMVMAISILVIGSTGCKNKKKIVDNNDPQDQVVKVDENLVKAKTTLQALLDDDSKSIAEKEKILADIKALNLDDPDVKDLIKKVETSIEKEKQRLQQEEEQKKIDALMENVLARAFNGIANAKSVDEANALIQQTLQHFTSDKANVLVIVYKGSDGTDYDEPTNILKYLNQLKDTKKSLNAVEKIHYDANNKIRTLELIKK